MRILTIRDAIGDETYSFVTVDRGRKKSPKGRSIFGPNGH
jgi:hypothetical protein